MASLIMTLFMILNDGLYYLDYDIVHDLVHDLDYDLVNDLAIGHNFDIFMI